jgi:hypothetical protein
MKRMKILTGTVLSLLVLAACGPGEVVVTVEGEFLDPDSGEQVVRPISDLPLQLVPFDRDAIFDSLGASAPSPEPQMPPHLIVARDSIAEARQQWQEAESQWLTYRDQLQEISTEMNQYNPAEAQYRLLFEDFNRVEGQYFDAEARKDEAFERFERLQQETFGEMEEFSALLAAWEDDAFADWEIVVSERLRGAGTEIVHDTTDATGRADLQPSPGQWWVYARSPIGVDELYWNVPVTVERGDPVEVRLTPQNADVRPIF